MRWTVPLRDLPAIFRDERGQVVMRRPMGAPRVGDPAQFARYRTQMRERPEDL